MNITECKQKIANGKYDAAFSKLYSDVQSARQRYLSVCEGFEKYFGKGQEIRIFSAPGRTEVGGNHTDHQHGRVLAGSVNLDVVAIVSPNNDGVVRIKSKGYGMDTVSLSSLEKLPEETGKAAALIRGMCASFKQNGYNISGFDAYTVSNVLKGSGLSSSAAFEVLIGTVLNGMFNDGKITPIEIAKMAQRAESEFFGKPCGLLDQTASASGGFTAVDFKNPASPEVERIDFDLQRHGYVLCVVDTGGNHANLTQDYADITLECKKISDAFNKEYLREVNPADFYANIAKLRKTCGDRAVLRALHFFNEDERAELQKQALKNDNFNEFLRLVNLSGESSYKYLQNIYSNSNVAEQGLALAIALTQQFLNGEGACRVHGGGFAGTIQCYIPKVRIDEYKQFIEAVFGENSCCILNIRAVGGSEITQ